MDGALARVEREFAEELEIACLPGCDTLTHTTILRIEMLGSAGKTGWHGYAGLLERGLGNIAQEGLIEGLQRLIGIGEHIPSGGLTLIHAQIIIAIDETTRETGEENAYLEFGHIGMTLDDAPLVTVAIEEEQTIGLAQGDTGLIEQTIVETDILALSLRGYLDHLEGLEGDIVGLGKGHDIGNEHRCTGTETANGQGALNDAIDAVLQLETLAEGIFGTAGIIAPMTLLDLSGGVDLEIDQAFEGLGFQMHMGIGSNVEPEVDSFIDGKTCDETMLMIDMRAQRANAIGGENMILHTTDCFGCKNTIIF